MTQSSPRPDPEPWHAIAAERILDTFETGPEGLSPAEAKARFARYGANRLPKAAPRSALRRLLAQFDNLVIYVLLAAAAVTAILGHWLDSQVILAVVVLNAIIGFIQEGKAERALQAIGAMLAPRATVLREGHRVGIAAADLVPGDIVVLEPGDRVPADLRLLRLRGLRIQEAALTGESVAVDKSPDPVSADATLGDRAPMAYAGTLVAAGQGAGVVVATGIHTEIGKISGLMAAVEPLTTPLLNQMKVFARWLTGAILGFAIAVFFFGILVRDFSPAEMFMVVVGLSVAAIPEGLPAIMTVAMAIGVQRMASRHAIIRRLPAVETLGSVSVICTDKTGTLTRNEMTVRSIVTAEGTIIVGGTGYEPRGGFSRSGKEMQPGDLPTLAEITLAGALCNDAALREHDGGWSVEGDPMEGALIVAALKAGLDPKQEAKNLPRTDVIPFDARHRFMATLHHDHDGNGVIYVKGAPERLLDMCARQRHDGGDLPLDKDYWHARIEEVAAEGQRVLAMATMQARPEQGELRFGDVEGGLVLLGLCGLIDPPREEAVAAVAECIGAGIRVKMITGDHAGTARAIARQLGLVNAEDVLTGRDIDLLDGDALRSRVRDVDVFARTSPEHKLRLVEALQAEGQVTAMTGDGVNDSPALKRADVGVAMGRNGTEAAKEASEMVIADDNFASIDAAVREGRTVHDNLKKAIVFLLPVNGGESFSIITAILLGQTLPITPLQILWVNIVSSIGLAIALAFEPPEPDIMRRPPRPSGEALLSGFLIWRILLVSVLFVCGLYGVFVFAQAAGASVEEARTAAVNTLVAMEVFYLFSVRYLRTPSLTLTGVKGTPAVLVAVVVVVLLQLFFTYAPVMGALFQTRPLDPMMMGTIVLVGAALFIALEGEKWIRQRLGGSGR